LPAVHSQSPNLLQNGPTIPIHVWFSKSELEVLETSGKPIPDPVEVTALIDTGAQSTCIAPSVANALRLPVVGASFVNSVSQRNILVNQYAASVVFPNNVAVNCKALGISPEIQDVDCLIGRDILSKGVFVYIGETGSFTLSL
jgi:predicted aspartyl protease